MRVLLVTHYYPQHRSGVELVAAEIAGRLVRRGLSITWAASGPLTESLPAGVTALPMRSWNTAEHLTGFAYPLWHPADLRTLRKAVRSHDAVHLHEHLYVGNLAAQSAARTCGRPIVVTQHTSQIWPSPDLSLGLRAVRLGLGVSNRVLGRRVLGNADQCTFINTRAMEYFERIVRFRRPPVYLPNGVDLDVFRELATADRAALKVELGWSANRPAMLFVGRMIAKKGLGTLRELAARMPECDWHFVGWGPIDPALWGLRNVHCCGRASHETVARCCQAADLFVLPSLVEGFPLVVQESMACGTPALIGPEIARGAPEALEHLIAAEPTAAAFEQRIREVLPTLGARREAVARCAREHWDWEVCADRYRDILAAICPRESQAISPRNRCGGFPAANR